MSCTADSSELDILRNDFNRLDEDLSGFIKGSELAALLESQLGRPATSIEAREALESFDVDHDGRISFAEYARWVYPGAWPYVVGTWAVKVSTLCTLDLELTPPEGIRAGRSALGGGFRLTGLVFDNEEHVRNNSEVVEAACCELSITGIWKRLSRTQLTLVIDDNIVSTGPDAMLEELPLTETILKNTISQSCDESFDSSKVSFLVVDVNTQMAQLGLKHKDGELQIRCHEQAFNKNTSDDSTPSMCEALECVLLNAGVGLMCFWCALSMWCSGNNDVVRLSFAETAAS